MHLTFSSVKKEKQTTQFLPFKQYLFPFLFCCSSFFVHAQVSINEIFAGGSFELQNTGTETIDISSYYICTFPTYTQLSDLTVECGSLTLNPDETVVISDFSSFMSNDGELGLYATNNFGSAEAIVAYVEWGSSAHQRASVAIEAGLWTADNAASAFSNTESLLYDGEGNQATDWSVHTDPSICPMISEPAPVEMSLSLIHI